MINKELLYRKIDEAGLSVALLAKQIKLSREGLYKKIRGKTEFKTSEISKISKILSLSMVERDSIFFAA